MWEMVFPFGFPLLVGSLAFAAGVRDNRRRLQSWKDAASWNDLKVGKVSSPLAMQLKLEAQTGPLQVRIEEYGRNRYARVEVTAPGPPGFNGVRIRREVHKPQGAREIEIGDEDFDSAFFIEGPMRLVSALLDAEVRGILIRLDKAGELRIANGKMWVERLSPMQAAEVLPFLLDLSRRFSQPMDALQRLADNARADFAAGVRLRNLLLLVRELPGDPMTLEAVRNACSDPSPLVRLRAARELGAEGHGILRELAEGLADDDVSAQAISALGSELPSESTNSLLVQALRRRLLQTARACLEVLGRSGPAAVDTLAKVMAREKGELSAAAAAALGETGSAAAEPPLILALHREQEDLRVAAANALGRVGSASAVLPLKEAAERFPRDPDLRRATRQAIAGIQSRVQGASPGQLSLAGAEEGRLSLAEAEAGQLSLANDPAGQVSLATAEPGQLSLGGDAAD